MVNRPRRFVVGLLALGFACAGLSGLVEAQPAKKASYVMVSCKKSGELEDPKVVSELIMAVSAKPPTHLVLVAHGWNNSLEDAQASFSALTHELEEQWSTTSQKPDPFRPLVIGLRWPSLAMDGPLWNMAGDLVEQLIREAFPDKRATIGGLEKLLKLENDAQKSTTDAIKHQAARQAIYVVLKEAYGLDFAEVERADIFEKVTVLEMIRVLTFWKMKERAALVGKNAARELLDKLQVAYPDAKINLVGHSFGCKVWLSCVAYGTGPLRQVNSMVLLQAAASRDAFSQSISELKREGGCRSVLDRVRGPIVVTYSKHDSALGQSYPLGSAVGGQIGEIEGRLPFQKKFSLYQALGATGCDGEQVYRGRLQKEADKSAYKFGRGLFVLDGQDVIMSHGDFHSAPVARMIWEAIVQR